MNRDDIIRMAREAGWDMDDSVDGFSVRLERFAALVAAAEREACAHLVASQSRGNGLMSEETRAAIKHCADLIRSRT